VGGYGPTTGGADPVVGSAAVVGWTVAGRCGGCAHGDSAAGRGVEPPSGWLRLLAGSVARPRAGSAGRPLWAAVPSSGGAAPVSVGPPSSGSAGPRDSGPLPMPVPASARPGSRVGSASGVPSTFGPAVASPVLRLAGVSPVVGLADAPLAIALADASPVVGLTAPSPATGLAEPVVGLAGLVTGPVDVPPMVGPTEAVPAVGPTEAVPAVGLTEAFPEGRGSTDALPAVGLTEAFPDGRGSTDALPEGRASVGPGRCSVPFAGRSGDSGRARPIASVDPVFSDRPVVSGRRMSPVLTVARPRLEVPPVAGQARLGELTGAAGCAEPVCGTPECGLGTGGTGGG
jgi:hypothetical protein